MTPLLGDPVLPQDWNLRPLKYVAAVNARTLPETTDPDYEFRYVDIGAVGRGCLVEEPEVMRFGDAPSRARRVIRRHDTLVSTVRTYLRAVAHFDPTNGDLVASTGFAVLSPRRDVHPRFLYYWTASDPFIEEVVACSTGVSYPAVSASDVETLPVALPPLEAQKRIASFLDIETTRIDTLIARNERVRGLLGERRDSLLSVHCWQTVEGPRVPLEALVDSGRPIRYGIVLPGPKVDEGVPLIKGGDVHDQALGQGTNSKVAYSIEERHPKSRVREGDLVFTIRGSYGDVAQVPPNLDGANITQDVARIAPRSVDPDWLLLVLQAPEARSYADRVARGATIRGVNIEDLRKLRVPVPPLVEQRQGVSEMRWILNRLDELDGRVEREMALLRERRQALITAAVTGQLAI